MKIIKLALFISAASLLNAAHAENYVNSNMTIKFIRTVGDYQGITFDDTIELHFTTALQWPTESSCTNTVRVMIDASKSHMISAAYAAHTAGMKVTINADDTLPIRGGACELSYFDIIK